MNELIKKCFLKQRFPEVNRFSTKSTRVCHVVTTDPTVFESAEQSFLQIE
jgi:hypothetical protein